MLAFPPLLLAAQRPVQTGPVLTDDDPALAALLLRAATQSPRLRVSAARTAAARARVGPAGSRPDPMLMSGLQNFPLFKPGFTDEMTMKMVGVSQTMLFPGKQRVRRTTALRESDAVASEERRARAELVAAVKDGWYEIAYLDAALALTRQQRAALDGVANVALARYDAGAGSQADVLTARIDAAKVIDDENGLRADRASTVAALNALLDRASDTSIEAVTITPRVQRAAMPDPFGTAGGALPAVQELQTRAIQSGPVLVSHQLQIEAHTERVALARVEARPDFDIVLQYGQRSRLPDMVTLQVAIPLRVQQRTNQGEVIAAARADLIAAEAERDAQRNAVRASIAKLLTTAEQARARIALYEMAVLPQRRAAVDAALASYRGNSGALSQVLTAQAAYLSERMTLARAFSDFARSVAALELVVGSEVLP